MRMQPTFPQPTRLTLPAHCRSRFALPHWVYLRPARSHLRLLNFFRPSGLNPSLAGGPCLQDAVLLANADGLGLGPDGGKCDNTLPFNSAGGCVVVPFGDMDANYSNGSSNYSGFTANLRKVLTHHY
jgi:hypothetical protein